MMVSMVTNLNHFHLDFESRCGLTTQIHILSLFLTMTNVD